MTIDIFGGPAFESGVRVKLRAGGLINGLTVDGKSLRR